MVVACEACGKTLQLAEGEAVPPKCPACTGPLTVGAGAATRVKIERIGKYKIESLLGRGGMGEVYKALHPELGTHVAIKLIAAHAQSPDDTNLTQRFRREAQIAARIQHPGVVRVHDVGTDGDKLFMVMEYVEGRSLQNVIASGKLKPRVSARIVHRIAQALQAAHEMGVIHRDIKPGNVLVTARGEPRILDFGISRWTAGDERLTQSGDMVGTPLYMSPEQVAGAPEDVDARTDVFSLGVVFYEMLTGKSPFAAGNVYQVIKNVETHDPPPPSRVCSEVPLGYDAIVARAMAKAPQERYGSAKEFAGALSELLKDDDRTARTAPTPRSVPWRAIAIGAAALLAAAALVGWLRPSDDPPPLTLRQRFEAATTLHARETFIDELAGASTGEELYWRGIARKHAGAFGAAHEDILAAHERGYAPAAGERFVTWMYSHALLPLLVESELWISADAFGDLEPWLADTPREHFEFYRGCIALARRDIPKAQELLTKGGPAPDADVLYALALMGTWDFDAAAARVGGDYAPALLIRPRLTWQPYAEAVETFSGAVSARAPERRAAELLYALLRHEFGEIGPPGADPWAAAVTLRAEAAAHPDGGMPPEAARELLAKLPHEGPPSLSVTRLLLALAAGERDLDAYLEVVPDHPGLEEFAGWRDCVRGGKPAHRYFRGAALMLISRPAEARRELERFLADAEEPELELSACRRLVRLIVQLEGPEAPDLIDTVRESARLAGELDAHDSFEYYEMDPVRAGGAEAMLQRLLSLGERMMKSGEDDAEELAVEALRHARLHELTPAQARAHHAFGALHGRGDFDELFPEE